MRLTATYSLQQKPFFDVLVGECTGVRVRKFNHTRQFFMDMLFLIHKTRKQKLKYPTKSISLPH